MQESKISLINVYGIDDQKLRNIELLREWVSFNRFSSLHVAVILGRPSDVEEALKTGANPNAKDRRLWSPLHHAAVLHEDEMIQLLLRNGADPTSLNDYNGTYQDILHLTNIAPIHAETVIPVFVNDKQLSPAEYEAKTHSKYIQDYLIHPKWMIELWKLPFSPMRRFNEEGLFNWVKQTFPYEISSYRKVSHENFILAAATQEKSVAGLGIFATRQYLPFELIGEYVGVIDKPTRSSYTFEYEIVSSGKLNIDAQHYSNAISRINDGFPNLGVIETTNSRGLPTRVVLITLETINPGSQLCFNYGYHPVKEGPYIELRGKELREFIKKYDLDHLKRCQDKVPLRLDEFTLDDLVFLFKFRYLLNSPNVVFALVLDGSISAEEGQKILDFAVKELLINEQPPSLIQVALRWRQTLDLLKGLQTDEINHYIQSLINRLPFKLAVRLIDQASQLLQTLPWSAVHAQLEKKALEYQPFYVSIPRRLS